MKINYLKSWVNVVRVLIAPILQTVHLDLTAATLSNDRFSNRIVLVGTHLSAEGSNVEASKEAGEPDHAGNLGGRSIWWAWTAPADGELQITTDGSEFDTLLGVYTGTKVSALSTVASNDDHGESATSRVRFEVSQGTQYQIAIDGYCDDTITEAGNATITVSFLSGLIMRPANDNFANRIPLTGLVVPTNGSNVHATRETAEPNHAQKSGDTSIWFNWTAPVSGAVRVSSVGSSFDTLLAVYSGSSLTSLTELAFNDDIDTAAGILTSAANFDVQAGQIVQIAVDGFDGAAGTVTLRIETESIGLTAPRRLSDGRFQVAITGVSNRNYSVEATGNLVLWTAIATVFNTNGTVIFTDPVARNLKLRFYRVLLR